VTRTTHRQAERIFVVDEPPREASSREATKQRRVELDTVNLAVAPVADEEAIIYGGCRQSPRHVAKSTNRYLPLQLEGRRVVNFNASSGEATNKEKVAVERGNSANSVALQ